MAGHHQLRGRMLGRVARAPTPPGRGGHPTPRPPRGGQRGRGVQKWATPPRAECAKSRATPRMRARGRARAPSRRQRHPPSPGPRGAVRGPLVPCPPRPFRAPAPRVLTIATRAALSPRCAEWADTVPPWRTRPQRAATGRGARRDWRRRGRSTSRPPPPPRSRRPGATRTRGGTAGERCPCPRPPPAERRPGSRSARSGSHQGAEWLAPHQRPRHCRRCWRC